PAFFFACHRFAPGASPAGRRSAVRRRSEACTFVQLVLAPSRGDTDGARQRARASDQVVSMSSKFILVAALATAATLAWQSAAAQDSASAPVSREQRKADTAAANKAGQLTPAGQGGAPVSKSAATAGSAVSRDQ